MTAKKHLHIYKRVDIGRKGRNKETGRLMRLNSHVIYKCITENCTHSLTPELIVDRHAGCHKCGSEFVVTQRMVGTEKLVYLRCEDCKQDKKTKATEQFLNQLGLGE